MKKKTLIIFTLFSLIGIGGVSFAGNTGACYINLLYYGQRDIPGLYGDVKNHYKQQRCFPGLTDGDCARRVKHFEYLNRNAEKEILELSYKLFKGEPCSDTFFNN